MRSKGFSIQLNHVSKKYGGVQVLHDLNLTIPRGKITAILGASGAGKTTLLRLICGLESPSRGSIHFDERDVTSIAPADRLISLVFQHHVLFPHLTVKGNIEFGLETKKELTKDMRAEKVDKILKFMNLESKEFVKPATLSGGESQRVSLARAIVTDPSALLLDEPLLSLDPELRQKLREEILRIHREFDLTIILVTHDVEDVFELADSIVFLYKGKALTYSSSRELFFNPKWKFVADFLRLDNQLTSNDFTGIGISELDLEELVRNSLVASLDNSDILGRVSDENEDKDISLDDSEHIRRDDSIKEQVSLYLIHPQNIFFEHISPNGTETLFWTVTSLIFRGASTSVSARSSTGLTLTALSPSKKENRLKIGSKAKLMWRELPS